MQPASEEKPEDKKNSRPPENQTDEPPPQQQQQQATPPIQPCACCAALAQLRMPWMEAAMYQAARQPQPQSYPYEHPCSCAQPHPASATPADASEVEARRTVFFKLPTFGKQSAAKDAGKESCSGAAAGKQKTKSFLAKTLSAASKQPESAGADQADKLSDSEAPESESKSDDSTGAEGEWTAASGRPKFKLSFGLQGLAVSIFGILVPAFIFASSILSTPKRITLVALHHPVETIIEFLLVASIPVVNFLVWSAISKNRANLSRWLIMALGGAVGTALVIALVSFACLFGNHEDLADAIGTDFTMGFTWLGVISLLSALTSSYLANRLRLSWELQSSRQKVSVQVVTGIVIAMLAFVASEFRPWCIRIAQYNAVAKNGDLRREGLRFLRQLSPEREMRMECSDSRAAGLAGLFFPIKSGVQQQLYFLLTGTPYSFRDANAKDLTSMSDDYLSRHVVGDKIPQLDLTRSTLNGVLHANTLTSTLNWTFVVKNGSSTPRELRAEIGLPAGAAVTRLTVWHRGEPDDADFVASGNKLEGVAASYAGNETPGMVTDLGHGRVLVHCYPVPAEDQLKIRVTMVVPLRSEKDGQSCLVTPQLISSNFDLEGEHLLRLRSQTALESNVRGLEKSKNPSGESIISGSLTQEQLESSPLLITAARVQTGKPYAVLDKLAVILRREDEREKERDRLARERLKEQQRKEQEKAEKAEMGQVVLMIDGSKGVPTQIQDLRKLIAQQHKQADKSKEAKTPRIITVNPEYAIEDITRVAAPAPRHLVVVIDGSVSMQKFAKDLSIGLAGLPKTIPCSLIIASQENEKISLPKALKDVLPGLSGVEFAGGQDNLKAVVRAAELAGETKDSAVLWIHGPQPVINQEIYIMSPYEAQPAFYELPVVAGTDTFEFFKNHAEIGPFIQVPRNGISIAADLSDFFSRWSPSNNGNVATISQNEKLPAEACEPGKDEGHEIIMLRAIQECNRLIASRHFHRAARIATRYGFVSSVSSALLGNSPDRAKDLDTNPGAAQQAEDAESVDKLAEQPARPQETAGGASNQEKSAAAPMLQGATNGTVGPTGSDATVIQGVNTAGTVRVNNLANLEALLNIIANLGELGALLSGLGLVVHGFMNKSIMKLGEDVELGAGGRIVLGVVLIMLGVALPGVLNWFVASARDANLFS